MQFRLLRERIRSFCQRTLVRGSGDFKRVHPLRDPPAEVPFSPILLLMSFHANSGTCMRGLSGPPKCRMTLPLFLVTALQVHCGAFAEGNAELYL